MRCRHCLDTGTIKDFDAAGKISEGRCEWCTTPPSWLDDRLDPVMKRLDRLERQSGRMMTAIENIMCQRPHQFGWSPFGENICHEHCLRCIGETLIKTWDDEQ